MIILFLSYLKSIFFDNLSNFNFLNHFSPKYLYKKLKVLCSPKIRINPSGRRNPNGVKGVRIEIMPTRAIKMPSTILMFLINFFISVGALGFSYGPGLKAAKPHLSPFKSQRKQNSLLAVPDQLSGHWDLNPESHEPESCMLPLHYAPKSIFSPSNQIRHASYFSFFRFLSNSLQ